MLIQGPPGVGKTLAVGLGVKGKRVRQKAPLKPKEVWAIRAHLQMQNRVRELALFDLGIDSKLAPAIW